MDEPKSVNDLTIEEQARCWRAITAVLLEVGATPQTHGERPVDAAVRAIREMRKAQEDYPNAISALSLTVNDLQAAEARIAELERERDEAAAEVAETLDFLKCEMGWEYFREDMLYGRPDDIEKQRRSAENARKYENFLKRSGRGIAFLKRFTNAEEGLRLYREFFKAVVERSPNANAAPLIAWERKQEGKP